MGYPKNLWNLLNVLSFTYTTVALFFTFENLLASILCGSSLSKQLSCTSCVGPPTSTHPKEELSTVRSLLRCSRSLFTSEPTKIYCTFKINQKSRTTSYFNYSLLCFANLKALIYEFYILIPIKYSLSFCNGQIHRIYRPQTVLGPKWRLNGSQM